MNFAKAQELMHAGKAVCRGGWNGKGMFSYYVPAGRYAPTTPIGKAIAANEEDGLVAYNPYYALKTVSGQVQAWSPNTMDVLATDWEEHAFE
jgi:hypothetical protein